MRNQSPLVSVTQACRLLLYGSTVGRVPLDWGEQRSRFTLVKGSSLELSLRTVGAGFEIPEIDLLIDGLEVVTNPDADDQVPAVTGTAVTRAGDLWQLGRHRVLCGDALQAESHAGLMGSEKAHLVITDPPYNVVIDGHASGLGRTRHKEYR